MKTIAETIARGRKAVGMSQSELARKLQITPQSVQAWESGRSVPRTTLLVEIAGAIEVPPEELFHLALQARGGTGQDTLDMVREIIGAPPRKGYSAEAEINDRTTPRDEEAHLYGDEASIPFLIEAEVPGGHGRTAIEMSPEKKLRFSKYTLHNQGVQFDKAVCITVHGDSMAPILPDGSTIAVDTGSTAVRDGKTYAINQSGHLRVKTLHRLPDGGIRLRSFNRDEYPDEEYSLEEMDQRDISIIGRVFWSSVLW